MITLVQASDLHFGEPFDPVAAEALLTAVHTIGPDLLVLAGDLTQRAKVREFADARTFIDRLPQVPTVFTPGNHDVPLFRIAERLLHPFRNYRRFIEDRLDSVTRIDGVTVVALNTAAPRTAIVNGTVRASQMEYARRAFAEVPAGDLRVAVLHHHMAAPGDWTFHPPLPVRWKVLEELEASGVDLILSGHLHRSFLSSSADVLPDRKRSIPIAHSGTATSTRGRGRERGRNTFNVVYVTPEALTIEHHMYAPEAGAFRPFARHMLPRGPESWIQAQAKAGGPGAP